MLKRRDILSTQANSVKSKRTGKITFYIVLKEPVQIEKYEEIKE